MNSEELTPYRLDLAVVRETAQRIIQDFELFGIQINFTGNEAMAYDELMAQLQPITENLIRKDRPKLMQILYKIDISERNLSMASSNNPNTPLSHIISRLLIEREMQKVLTRRLHKFNQGEKGTESP